jgi:hypothetical protein
VNEDERELLEEARRSQAENEQLAEEVEEAREELEGGKAPEPSEEDDDD